MARRSRRNLQQHAPAPAAGETTAASADAGAGRQSWLAAAACALLVARPLYPSEATAQGHGLLAVMLWLLLLVIWLVVLAGQASPTVRFRWFDAAVLALIGLHTAAGVWAAWTASARPALNVLWEWIGFAACYLLVRQLFHQPKQVRTLVVVMIALAVLLSGYGLYQYAYGFPQTRALYQQDPEAELRAVGERLEPGSREQQMFVQRLQSTEPLATFALANSLAGFLTPWLIVVAGLLLAAAGHKWPSGAQWSTWIAAAATVAICGICLLLTKSRSAFLAVLIGMLGLLVFCRPAGWRIGWKVPLALGAAIVLLMAAAMAVGGLDLKVLAEAPKSLGYRLQYWQATLRIIADRPVFGCGPGNFQYTYTGYMLPEASEEIADPHNFLFEVWATAGTPAMLLLVGLLAGFFWTTLRPSARRFAESNRAADGPTVRRPLLADETAQPDRSWVILVGAATGLLLAVPLASIGSIPPSWPVYAAGLPPALLVAALLWPWVEHGTLPRTLPVVAAGALLVNLAAAGGIGFPGIAQSLWLLMALGINATEGGHRRPATRGSLLMLTGLVLLVVVACYASAYRPVLDCRANMQRALNDPHRAEQYLQAAAAADPLDADPALELAEFYLQKYLHSHQPQALEQFRQWCSQVLKRRPNSSAALTEVGDRYWRLLAATGNPAFAHDAAGAFEQAVARYPTLAALHARWAMALAAAGKHRRAAAAATRALELDHLTPHADKKLPGELKALIERLVPPADNARRAAL